ncbi:MAG: NUDIX domain-containing protein, partial [Thermomicrobiales bacterium]
TCIDEPERQTLRLVYVTGGAMAVPVKLKVMAYITHGSRLLVFREPDFPDAGIQVPGGSVAAGERLEVAVMREAFEETGLKGLSLGTYLGDVKHDLSALHAENRSDFSPLGRPEIHHRHYYHLMVAGDVPESWQHTERDPSEGVHESILFEFTWVQLPDCVPGLMGLRDERIPELIAELGYS